MFKLCTEIEIEISLLTKSGPPGGHTQITIMTDTKQQYIKLNIRGEISISSRYVFSCVICFRFIHFILISTAHALFLTCLPVSIYGT
jgi:hypothetical protein